MPPCSSFRAGLAAVVAALLLSGCQPFVSPRHAPAMVVAFGDSITRGYGVPVGAGWVELLAARPPSSGRRRPLAIVNAGGNGNTSAEGLGRIEADVLPHLPGLVLVEFGGNDAVEGARNVSVDDFERNLLAIHRAVTTRGGTVALVTFPPVIDAWHVYGKSPYFVARGGLDQELNRYRERTRAVARRLGLPLFDLDRLLRDRIAKNDPAAYLVPDGVHLTPEGNRIVAAAMEEFIASRR